MANRYSDLTPTAYTPLTLEEIAMVPAMRRKQHDAILAQQEALSTGLAKVDPHSKHFNEAVALKKSIEEKMATTAAELASQGVNPDMIGKTMALNREVQDLMSPTGKLGQINAEKINIAKIDKEYDDAAIKNNWTAAETKYWKDKALKEYMAAPVYGEDGRLTPYVAPKGAPTRIDYSKAMDEYAKNAKMSTEEFAKAVQTLDSDIGSGQKAILGESYGKKFGNNYNALLAAYNTMKREMSDPTSAIYKSMEYERRNPAELLKTIAQQSEIYKQKVFSEESGKTINPFGSNDDDRAAAAGASGIPGVYADDYNTQEVGGKNMDSSEIERIGKINSDRKIVGYDQTTHQPIYSNEVDRTPFTVDKIKDPRQKALYEQAWEQATKGEGIILDGKRVHLNPALIKRGMNDRTVAFQLLRSIKQNPAITLTSKLLTNDIELDNSGFAASIGKTADDRDKQMRKQLRLTNTGARKLLDPNTGESITFTEAKRRYNLKGIDAVSYHGYVSPLNWETDSFNGVNSKASPHVITVENENGEPIEFKTSRLNSDNVGVNIDRYNDLNENYRKWSISRDQFIPFKSKSPSLSKLKVKYNTKNPIVDPQRGVLDMEVLDENGVPHYMTQAEFVNSVNATR